MSRVGFVEGQMAQQDRAGVHTQDEAAWPASPAMHFPSRLVPAKRRSGNFREPISFSLRCSEKTTVNVRTLVNP